MAYVDVEKPNGERDIGSAFHIGEVGQSLIPLLNLRLASAERLIDVGRLDELRYIRLDCNDLRIGACGRPRSRNTAR